MGVQILSKGVDAEDYAVEYAAPVTRGLEGVFFMNTSLDKCRRNYAPGKKLATIVGEPTVNSQYMSGQSAVNYIQTDITETVEMTSFIVARALHMPPGSPIPAGDQVILWGNYAQGEWSGLVQWFGQSTSFSNNGGYELSDGSNANMGAGLTTDAAQWRLYSGRWLSDRIQTKDHTTGLTSERITSGGPRRISDISRARKIRIGSGYQPTQTGKWDMALNFCYSVALNDAEREIVAQDIKAYMARRGIIV